MCVCVCVCVCVHVCVCMYVHACVHAHTCICVIDKGMQVRDCSQKNQQNSDPNTDVHALQILLMHQASHAWA